MITLTESATNKLKDLILEDPVILKGRSYPWYTPVSMIF